MRTSQEEGGEGSPSPSVSFPEHSLDGPLRHNLEGRAGCPEGQTKVAFRPGEAGPRSAEPIDVILWVTAGQ